MCCAGDQSDTAGAEEAHGVVEQQGLRLLAKSTQTLELALCAEPENGQAREPVE